MTHNGKTRCWLCDECAAAIRAGGRQEFLNGYRTGAEAERAAVVAWTHMYAGWIERGEHLGASDE